MPRYDPDVIAALAEGRLDPEEAAALEREIKMDSAAAAQLAAHRTALQASATAPRPTLSGPERSELRAAVSDALGITAAESALQQRPRRIAWGPLGVAAAALVGLVAVVPIVGLLSTGGADNNTALELSAEATVAPAEAEARTAVVSDEFETRLGDAEVDDALTAEETAGFDATQFGSSTTSPAAGTAAAPAATATTQSSTSSSGTSSESTTTTSQAAAESGEVERLAAELGVIRSEPGAATDLAEAAIENHLCWDEDSGIRSNPPPERYVFEYDNGELMVIVYFELAEGQEGPFQVWDLPDCEELLVVP